VYSTDAALSAEGQYDTAAARIESIDLIDRCIVGTCSPVAQQMLMTRMCEGRYKLDAPSSQTGE
jgi:hypothetical protein